MPRMHCIEKWLHQCCSLQDFKIEPASADASFRRYFRIFLGNGETRILMDAPPTHEDCRPFLKVARLLEASDVHVPHVFAENLEDGLLLLSDLGRKTYLDVLTPDNARALYHDANLALIRIQSISCEGALPPYDRALLTRELRLFPEWYIQKHLQRTLTSAEEAVLLETFETILENNLKQPQVLLHRDYHSRNLMFIEGGAPLNPGVIDFQDAVIGPLTYDLVSLYRDAYITWDEALELDFVIRYWEAARRAGLPVALDFHDFYRDYEWMGVQRQLKVLGIFARLNYRDHKAAYLQDMPRVLAYLRRTLSRYRELTGLLKLMDTWEAPA